MSATARIMAYLGMNPADFNRGVDQAHNKVSGFSSALTGIKGKLAAAFSIGMVAKGIKDAIAEGDRIEETANNLGLTTDELQALTFMFYKTGSSFETLEKALNRVNNVLGEAQNNSADAIDKLQKLGLTIEDIDQGSAGRTLEKMALYLKDNGYSAGAMADVFDIVGQKARNLTNGLKVIADTGLQSVIETAKEAGRVLSREELSALGNTQDRIDSIVDWGKKKIAQLTAKTIRVVANPSAVFEDTGAAEMGAIRRQKELDRKAADIMLDNAEKRREMEFDALSNAEKRLQIEKTIAWNNERIAQGERGGVSKYERAILERDNLDLQKRLIGIEDKPIQMNQQADQFRRIGANVFGGTTIDNTAKKSLTVQEKMLVEMRAVRMAAEKAKNGVF